MLPVTAGFLLMLITHAGDTLSFTKIKEFPSRKSCEEAAAAVNNAIGGKPSDAEIGCISMQSLQEFQRANR
jgi:hypothetical protein